MMEDSYEKSIIDFLASEIANDLIRDPQNLKFKISEKIKDMVYSKKVVKKAVTTKRVKAKTTTEEVKQQPKARTRRIKKETEQHD